MSKYVERVIEVQAKTTACRGFFWYILREKTKGKLLQSGACFVTIKLYPQGWPGHKLPAGRRPLSRAAAPGRKGRQMQDLI